MQVDIELEFDGDDEPAGQGWSETVSPGPDWRFGACAVRPTCREVVIAGKVRSLQPRAFDLLVHLIERRSQVVTTDDLLDAVWGDQEVQPGALTMAIARIRTALRDAMADRGETIRTYHRVGYRFVAPIEDDAIGRQR
ncbi:winged helix-turn-helix domain-containing protein [Mitsuaria sp. GD03876]|uniref:winged helix-turn-helix domain-containing protein n=1 Tax=Mitsuaria sp. GD03876 TaxID=2975399 RepID=UPI00244A0193|nr:winged helix-turn-helix domain-containing protein [Mitsuaria sp. GD03876]MDH0865931.1 winged helix-turn-helix domain-containing protein [Mitsuaria sp. GD03876]